MSLPEPSASPGASATNATTWRFPAAFWTANGIELFERAAYYGTFIALSVFLTRISGFSDVEAGWVGAGFAGLIYLLPLATGAAADHMGYRNALLLAFVLLTIGYAGIGLVPGKVPVIFALILVAIGGAFVKPTISGTVSRYSNEATRARAFSIFYMIVNIGSFSGKTVAGPVRKVMGIEYVPLYSAGAAALALVLVALFFRPKEDPNTRPRSLRESLGGLGAVLKNGRFLALVFITAGFWLIQGQLYASMPKYVLRMVGEGASPEWYANVNPFVVVMLVVPITQLGRRMTSAASITIGLALIPLSALVVALSPYFGSMALFGTVMPAITVAMLLGIALQGLAECFLSPRYLEFSSKQAPPGQEGLYLGYCHINTFFAWLSGFILSGYLLEAFCPDPATLSAADQAQRLAALAGQGAMPAAYEHAHYIWYVFAGVGVVGLLAMFVFLAVTRERRRQAS